MTGSGNGTVAKLVDSSVTLRKTERGTGRGNVSHEEIRAKVPAEVLAAAEQYEAVDDNWPEARNAMFETVAEGSYTKEGLRAIYRDSIQSYRNKVAAGLTRDAGHSAAYAVLVAEASLYAKEEK